ncbi:MAG: hypothetical protein RLZZ546_1312 [Bacteroidota bacterium]|jgi:hypothetical protein
MKFKILFLLLIFYFYGHSQYAFQIVLPQNIYITGEDINCVVLHQKNTSLYPLIVVSDLQNNVLLKKHFEYKGQDEKLLIEVNDLPPGTYKISSLLFNKNSTDIMEEQCFFFHVIDENVQQKYFQAEGHEIKFNFSERDLESYRTREIIAIPTQTKDYSFALNKQSQHSGSYFFFQENNMSEVEDRALLYFVNNPTSNNLLALCFNSGKVISPITLNKDALGIPISKELINEKFYFIDYLNYKKTDLSEYKIKLPSSRVNLKEVSLFDNLIEYYNNKLLKVKLNTYFHPKTQTQNTNTSLEAIADNEYVLSKYLEFENIKLFFKEVVQPLKVENDKDNSRIILLNGQVKKWNTQQALLIIDGEIAPNHNALFEFNWQDLQKIKLYRKLSTSRLYYGNLARNGVIEVKTKKSKNRPDNMAFDPFIESLPISSIGSNDDTTLAYFLDLQAILTNKSMTFTHHDDLGEFIICDFDANNRIFTISQQYVVKSNYKN